MVTNLKLRYFYRGEDPYLLVPKYLSLYRDTRLDLIRPLYAFDSDKWDNKTPDKWSSLYYFSTTTQRTSKEFRIISKIDYVTVINVLKLPDDKELISKIFPLWGNQYIKIRTGKEICTEKIPSHMKLLVKFEFNCKTEITRHVLEQKLR